MKKILFAAIATFATLAAPSSFAQAQKFQGLSALAVLNLATSSLEQTRNSTSTSSSGMAGSGNLRLQAEYTLAVQDRFAITAGGSMGLSDLALGKGDTSTNEVKLRGNYSLYAAPGYAINNTTLLYGKAAWLQTEVVDGRSVTVDGIGYGMGVKLLRSPQTYYQLEVMFNKYQDAQFASVTDRAKNYLLLLGVGYKF